MLVRGYYALGDRAAPARLGMIAVGVNLAINLALVWPLAERLAISTATAAGVQVVLLAAVFSPSLSPLAWSELIATHTRSLLAAGIMALAVVGCRRLLAAGGDVVALRAFAAARAGNGPGGASVYLAGRPLSGLAKFACFWLAQELPTEPAASSDAAA